MIVLLVMTDGRRDCIERTIPSALANINGLITRRVIHDDSDNAEYAAWLRDSFPTFSVVSGGHRGFGGAIANAWRYVCQTPERFVFHLEDDFTFNRPVDLTAMAATLDAFPYLIQLALRRQPWNAEEQAAGGIVEMHPADYDDMIGPAGKWLEHRRNFTTNPSLYRRSLCERGWPEVEHSEGQFGLALCAEDPGRRFAYWGGRDSGQWVKHIGTQRIGDGY